MSYQFELHAHTKEVSACSYASAEQLVKAYYKKGYAGMVITDHFFNGNCAISNKIPWRPRVKAFCKGYEMAKKAASNIDFDVFFGLEYSYHGTDFLTYGIDEEFLLNHPDLLDWPIETYFERVHEAGGFIIHAHPFREAFYISEVRLFTDYIDAVEVENLGNRLRDYNEKAFVYAKENGLPMTKGTDIHFVEDAGIGGMKFEKRPRTMEQLIEMIKKNTYESLA